MFAHDIFHNKLECLSNSTRREPRGRTIDLNRKTERSDTTNLQYSIVNIQFPDKAGFTLRYNPASGICATLRPAKLVRVKVYPLLLWVSKYAV
jgi:hypothetical protein